MSGLTPSGRAFPLVLFYCLLLLHAFPFDFHFAISFSFASSPRFFSPRFSKGGVAASHSKKSENLLCFAGVCFSVCAGFLMCVRTVLLFGFSIPGVTDSIPERMETGDCKQMSTARNWG